MFPRSENQLCPDGPVVVVGPRAEQLAVERRVRRHVHHRWPGGQHLVLHPQVRPGECPRLECYLGLEATELNQAINTALDPGNILDPDITAA